MYVRTGSVNDNAADGLRNRLTLAAAFSLRLHRANLGRFLARCLPGRRRAVVGNAKFDTAEATVRRRQRQLVTSFAELHVVTLKPVRTLRNFLL
jgi:hypothetical protein